MLAGSSSPMYSRGAAGSARMEGLEKGASCKRNSMRYSCFCCAGSKITYSSSTNTEGADGVLGTPMQKKSKIEGSKNEYEGGCVEKKM